MIKLYIYDVKTGGFLYEDVGNPDNITDDLGWDKDFTLVKLPSHDNLWYWIDNSWQSQPKT